MNCLPCFGSKESEINEQEDLPVTQTKGHPTSQPPVRASRPNNPNQDNAATDANENNEVADNPARNFGFREMAMATKNFRRETLLGESRFGKVYKGTLQGTGQVVAVKQLDRHGTKANKEFLAEVMMLSRIRHPNLVGLIGYCADGDQRILVYEYMEKGSVKNHLHEVPPEREPLDWITRMKIAAGAAEALEYLHEKTNPPILYRTFTSTNILLDGNLEPKLTDYGLVRLEVDTSTTMQQRMVSNVGCAPEYEQNGELTPKSDVYSFGVVLLELITGKKSLDTTLPVDEQNLTKWAQPFFKDPKRFPEMADPLLKGSFPEKSLNQAVGVAAMCVQEDPSVRPMISDVVAALSFLTMAPPPQPQPQLQPQPQSDPATASTNDPDARSQSSCSSSLSIEVDENDYSCSDSEDEDEQQYPMRTKTDKAGYNEDRCGTSSSESLYNEDDYWEEESHHEETSYRSMSKPKSIKRKGTFGTDKSVSRNSSKGYNKSLKKHSIPSLRKKSVSRKPSNTHFDPNSSKKLVDRKSSKTKENVDVSLSKKTHDLLEDGQSSSKPYESNDKSFSTSSRFNTQSGSRRSKGKKLTKGESSDSSDSCIEILDGEEGINARLLEDTYVPI